MVRNPPLDVTLATFADRPGGVWRHMLDLAGGLEERDVRVSVAVPAHAHALRADARARDMELRGLGDRSADVWHVHLHDTLDRRAIRGLVRRRIAGQATVATEHLPRNHATDPTAMPGRRTRGAYTAKTLLKRAALAATGRTIVVSAASQRFMQERYRVPAATLNVVPNALRPPADPVPPTPADDGVTVLAVGSLIVQKGMDVLIDAAGGARGWRVRIVGNGPHRERLEERIRAREAPVRLVGWSDDVARELAAADIFCLPSRWEACPYVVLEAMAAGRPIVAAAVDGVPELVQEGQTGRLVPPDDPVRLRAAIDALAADPDLREQWGRAAAERCAREHRFDDMVDATIDVYRDAAADARRGVGSRA